MTRKKKKFFFNTRKQLKKKIRFPKKKKVSPLTIFKLNLYKKSLYHVFTKKKKRKPWSYLTRKFLWNHSPKKSVSRFFPYNIESFGKGNSTKFINVFGSRVFNYMDIMTLKKVINQLKKNRLFVDQKLQKVTDLNFLKNIRNRRFYRLKRKLPLRGQRTHTNARTRRRRNIQ